MELSDLEQAINPPENDNEIPKLVDMRKVHLSLGQINRMRLVRDIKNLELKANLDKIKRQCGSTEQAQQGI